MIEIIQIITRVSWVVLVLASLFIWFVDPEGLPESVEFLVCVSWVSCFCLLILGGFVLTCM